MSKLGLSESQDFIKAKNWLSVFLTPKVLCLIMKSYCFPKAWAGQWDGRPQGTASLSHWTKKTRELPGGNDKDLQPGSMGKVTLVFFQNTIYPDTRSSESVSESDTLEFVFWKTTLDYQSWEGCTTYHTHMHACVCTHVQTRNTSELCSSQMLGPDRCSMVQLNQYPFLNQQSIPVDLVPAVMSGRARYSGTDTQSPNSLSRDTTWSSQQQSNE